MGKSIFPFLTAVCLLLMCERVRSYNIIHSCSELASITQGDIATTTRRRMLQLISVTSPLFTSLCVSTPGLAADMTKTTTATTTNLQSGGAAGILVDLPPDAVRSYLQYRIPLQTSADFYLFELHDLLSNTNEWGQIADLFTMNNSRGGQGSPSRMERDFTNTFRILGLSMPPDASEELREAQFRFEAAAAKIAKATAGIRRDLPVEIDKDAVPMALAAWDEGRRAVNDFFVVLNDTVGLNEMKPIPPYEEMEKYGRSQKRYLDLKKKIKLCQNRGGPTLSTAWGQLMVSGYLQDSCGIPDLDDYFYQ